MEGLMGVGAYAANGGVPRMYRISGRIKNLVVYTNDIIFDLIVSEGVRCKYMHVDSDNGFWCDNSCWCVVGGFDPRKNYYTRTIKINRHNAEVDNIFGIGLNKVKFASTSPDGFVLRDMIICPDANFVYVLNGYSTRLLPNIAVNQDTDLTKIRDMARSWKVFGPCNEDPYTDVIMTHDEMARTLTDGLYIFENCYILSINYLDGNARRIGICVDSRTLDICQRRFKDRDSVNGFWYCGWKEFYDYASLLPNGRRWRTKEIAVDNLGFFPGYSGNIAKFAIANKGPIEVQRIAIWPKKDYIKILECKQLGIDVRGTIRDDILEEVGRIEKERNGDRDRVDSLIDAARVNAKRTERIFAGTSFGVSHLGVNDMWPKNLVTPRGVMPADELRSLNAIRGIYSLEPLEEIKPLSWKIENPALTKAEKNYYRSDICMRPNSVDTTIKDVLASMNPEQTEVLYFLIGQAIEDKNKEIEKLKEEKQEEDTVMRDKYTIIARDAENNRVCHRVNITRVVFNKPATIVFWSDGTKTVVMCDKGEKFDKEKGLAMAIVKKTLGNEGFYFNIISNWVKNGKDKDPVSESKKDEKSAPAPKKTTRKLKKG